MKTSWIRGWQSRLLYIATLLLLGTPLIASATPFYEYFYSGNLFTDPATAAPDDPRNGSFLSLKITSPTPLFASDFDQKDTPGLNFRMTDGAYTLQYPGFRGSTDGGSTFVNGSASLVIYSLNAAGLPTAWDLYIAENLQDSRGHPWDRKGLISSYNSRQGEWPWDNSYIEGYGPRYVDNNPGQWRLIVQNNPTPVPEPSVPLLFGAGFIGLAALRRWRQKSSAA